MVHHSAATALANYRKAEMMLAGVVAMVRDLPPPTADTSAADIANRNAIVARMLEIALIQAQTREALLRLGIEPGMGCAVELR